MNYSVDDLVASLSSNHIGQEAMDLQALHAQLSQTLFAPTQSRPARDVPPRCTTPTAGSSSRWPTDAQAPSDDAADEAMVEDLLFAGPASPVATSAPAYPWASSSRAHAYVPSAPQEETMSESAFATSDPFYLAAKQAQQAATHQNYFAASPIQGGFFAAAARPAQSSPFLRQPMHAHDPRTAHGFNAFGQAQPQPLYAGVGHFGM